MDSKEYFNKYNELLEYVLEDYKLDNLNKLEKLKENLNEEDLHLILDNFSGYIEKNKKVRKMFLNRNIEVFNEKYNLKLIPSIDMYCYIKDLSSDRVNKLWDLSQLIYALYRSGSESFKGYINLLVNKIESFNKNYSSSDNMIMDIANTIRETISNNEKDPMEKMLKTSQQIANKYAEDLKSGKISMNDMFSSLTNMMGQIKSDTQNDDNLKNANLPNPEDLLKSFGLGEDFDPSKLMGDLENNNFNPMDLFNKMIGKNNKIKEKLTPEQLKEMEDFYANLKTEDLEGLEKIKDDSKSNPLGGILNSIGGSGVYQI